MPVTIDQLVALPHLGCELIAGHAGGSRKATWAHVCELKDPFPWLEGGELVMTTGMAIPRDPRRQPQYLARLADSGAAALAISRDLEAPSLSAEFLELADELEFPVLLVSIEVPFVTISRVVILANQDSAREDLVRQLSVFDALRTSGEPAPVSTLFCRLERISGYKLHLSTAAGVPLLPGVPPFPADYRALLRRSRDSPAQIMGGYVVSVPTVDHLAAFLLGLDIPGADRGSFAMLEHIATIAALQRANLEREREVERREGSELLTALLRGEEWPERSDRMFPTITTAELSLTLIDVADPQVSVPLLNQYLADSGCPHLMTSQRQILVLSHSDAPLQRLLAPLSNASAGRSRPFYLRSGFTVAERQARRALLRAKEQGEPFVDASSIASELDWLPVDPAITGELVNRTIGVLLDHKRCSTGHQLLMTLKVWFESGQRPGDTSKRLAIHPHTLAYRLRQVETLTGRDLSTPSTRTELWLALRLFFDEC